MSEESDPDWRMTTTDEVQEKYREACLAAYDQVERFNAYLKTGVDPEGEWEEIQPPEGT